MENLNNAEEKNIEVKKSGFFRRLVASIIDQYICFGFSVIILYGINLILELAGYKIVEIFNASIIAYAVTNVLYFAILNSSKLNDTLGRKFLKVK